MISIAFLLCSSLLLTSAFPQSTELKEVEQQGIDVILKVIMSNVMQDVFGGKSMPQSIVNRTMEQLEKRDSEFARILHMVLQRVQEIQTEGVDVVAARLANYIITRLGEKIKAIKELHQILGKEEVDKLFGKLALKAEALIKEKFGKKKKN